MSPFKKGNKEWMKRRPTSEEDKKATREGRRKRWLREKYNLPLVKEEK